MRLTAGLGALAHGRGRRVAIGSALAGAALLAVGLAAMASGPNDTGHRATPRGQATAAPTTVAPATTAPPTAAPAPTTTEPSAAPEMAVVSGDAGDEHGEYGDHGDEYDVGAAGDTMPTIPTRTGSWYDPIADGRHVVLLVGVNVEAGMVELVELGQPDDLVRLMYVTTGYDLTGLAGAPEPQPFWATVEGGLVTLLEPIT